MQKINFIDFYGSFTIEKPENVSGLYFPLASEAGLKSSITPNGLHRKKEGLTPLPGPQPPRKLSNFPKTRMRAASRQDLCGRP